MPAVITLRDVPSAPLALLVAVLRAQDHLERIVTTGELVDALENLRSPGCKRGARAVARPAP